MKLRKRYIVLITLVITIIACIGVNQWWEYHTERACAESYNVLQCRNVWVPMYVPVYKPMQINNESQG